MSEKAPQGDSQASFAKRIDPKKGPLTPEQSAFIRRVELEQWKKNAQKLRGRNIFTGLVIGGLVLGICILVRNHQNDGYSLFHTVFTYFYSYVYIWSKQ
ncbi:Cytochrome c oxidase assembly factor 3-like, mitochondrial [Acipenser ruthenus]|uniref:Cytochrome c oxidase assembly factor 3 n=1 Tax=Acipenser ruthenus TaxID=7906 RepID=A0A662YJV1_ACIRT|nr:Cytochrome c oxidase assembly factor 3-like, mitochondrial [Acipenser ruthenus]